MIFITKALSILLDFALIWLLCDANLLNRACNILYNEETTKITNFEHAQYSNSISDEQCCPPSALSAPETFPSHGTSNQPNYERVDVWSFGVLIFEVLSHCLKPNPLWEVNYPPNSSDGNIYDTLMSSGEEWDKFPIAINRNFKNVAIVNKLWSLCDDCMAYNPDLRISVHSVFHTLSALESINS